MATMHGKWASCQGEILLGYWRGLAFLFSAQVALVSGLVDVKQEVIALTDSLCETLWNLADFDACLHHYKGGLDLRVSLHSCHVRL